jgi:hypothetical protein
MPERVEIGPKDQAQPKPEPKRRLSASEARQQMLLRVGLGIIGLAVVVWVIVMAAARIGVSREAARIYPKLHQEAPAGEGLAPQIRALGAALSHSQLRALVAGRSLDYARLTPEQQDLFSAIRPLTQPGGPLVTPYQVRLDRLGQGRYELRLIWSVPGRGQAVSESLRLG